ncbi:MAG: hypothetical protein OEZ02_04125 [Anaerolineae bacterium]|nr:hypothetical protein [Anaerolineae bacterium]
MSGLFDRIQSELDNRDDEGGLSPLDLKDLPSPLRKIMRIMLRKVEITSAELFVAVGEMPEDDRLNKDELLEVLKALIKQGWLITLGEGEGMRYKVNLRRKRGSTLANSFWSALDDKMEERKTQPPPEQDEA